MLRKNCYDLSISSDAIPSVNHHIIPILYFTVLLRDYTPTACRFFIVDFSFNRSAVSAHFQEASWHLSVKSSTDSSSKNYVDFASVLCNISFSLSGLSGKGHGRKWFSLKGWFSLYCMNNGDLNASRRLTSLILALE